MFVLGTVTVFAAKKTEKINVNGQCNMCETRIETAATSLEGVKNAQWNKQTKSLEVIYDEKKVSTQQIQTSIAMAGHDTQLFSANDKKYAELPGCCQYQRNEKMAKMNHGTKNECNHDINATSGSCCEK